MPYSKYISLSTGLIGAVASANTIDQPHFEVAPVVILWAAEDNVAGTAPVVADFIVEQSDGSEIDLIAANGRTLMTGALTATPDAASSVALGNDWEVKELPTTIRTLDTNINAAFSPFSLTSNTFLNTQETRQAGAMFVASNTPFNIRAQTSIIESSGDFDLSSIVLSTAINTSTNHGGLTFGTSTSNPAISRPNSGSLLSAFTGSGLDVFAASEATASAPGSIAEQSVKLVMNYDFASNAIGQIDLADGAGEIQAEVTYTAYVP